MLLLLQIWNQDLILTTSNFFAWQPSDTFPPSQMSRNSKCYSTTRAFRIHLSSNLRAFEELKIMEVFILFVSHSLSYNTDICLQFTIIYKYSIIHSFNTSSVSYLSIWPNKNTAWQTHDKTFNCSLFYHLNITEAGSQPGYHTIKQIAETNQSVHWCVCHVLMSSW